MLWKYMGRRGAITDVMIPRHLEGTIALAAPAAVRGHAHLLPLDIDAGGLDAIRALIDLVTALVPLAYLVGGVVRDLSRLDRILLRIGVHIVTTALLSAMLVALALVFALHGTTALLWLAVCFVVLYRPVQQLGFRLIPASLNPLHSTHDDIMADGCLPSL
jgi:hypothetical protein